MNTLITSTEQLKALAIECGSHFFDADALRFFSSRIHRAVYGGRYFVTSEQQRGVYVSSGWIPAEPRAYTVRTFNVWHAADGSRSITFDAVEEAGGFQGIATRAEAHAIARELGARAYTFTSEEVDEITSSALDALEWSGLIYQAEDEEPVPADSLGLTFSVAAMDIMRAEVRSFISLIASECLPIRAAWSLEQIGHDLVLTMNGHGAGFWDRGQGALGERLTHWAKTLGELSLYLSIDDEGDKMLEILR